MFSSLAKLYTLLTRRHKIDLVLLFFFMFGGAFLEALGVGLVPALVGAAVKPEIVMNNRFAAPVLSALHVTGGRELLLFGGVALIGVFVVKTAYLYVLYYLEGRFVRNRQLQWSRELFSRYMRAPYPFLLVHNSAELLRNVLTEMIEIGNNVLVPILLIGSQTLIVIVITVLLLVAQPYVALGAIIPLAVMGSLFLRVTQGRVNVWGKKRQKSQRDLVQSVNEGLVNLKLARILGREDFFIKRFGDGMGTVATTMRNRDLAKRVVQPTMEFMAVIVLCGVALTLVLLGWQIVAVLPVLSLLAVALIRLKTCLNTLVMSATRLRYSCVAVDAVYAHLEELSGVAGNGSEAMEFHRRISLRNVRYRYPGAETDALDGITVEIEKDSLVAFVGSTGSGKTTLVDTMLGLLPPTGGNIEADGVDIRRNLPAWQACLGYVPQSIYLMDDTIRRNVAFGLKDEEIDEERVREVLRVAQILDFIEQLPEGLETMVGEMGVRLSGGQRQRLGIARALYNDPKILVLDEATAALDSVTEKSVLEALGAGKEGRTVIMVAHRLTTVRNCDCLHFLEEGRIVDSGTYEHLAEKNAHFRAMVNMQKE